MSAILLRPAEDTVFTALKAWLQLLLGLDGLHVVRELVNRVPTPIPPFALMTHISQTRVAWNTDFFQPQTTPASITARNDIDFVVQVDVFGDLSGSLAMAIAIAFRSSW